jgi:uncharacterized protein
VRFDRTPAKGQTEDGSMMRMNRRTLLRIGGIAALGAVLPLPWILQRRQKHPVGLRPDPRGVLDLPEGFSYRVLDSTGEAMNDGFRVPARPDGMGCFAGQTTR